MPTGCLISYRAQRGLSRRWTEAGASRANPIAPQLDRDVAGSMGLPARAQKGDDLREAAQNPIGDLISPPFQNNTNFDIGHTNNTQNVLNIQPVYPLHLDPSWTHHPTDPSGHLSTALPLWDQSYGLPRPLPDQKSVVPSSAWVISRQNYSSRRRSQYHLVTG